MFVTRGLPASVVWKSVNSSPVELDQNVTDVTFPTFVSSIIFPLSCDSAKADRCIPYWTLAFAHVYLFASLFIRPDLFRNAKKGNRCKRSFGFFFGLKQHVGGCKQMHICFHVSAHHNGVNGNKTICLWPTSVDLYNLANSLFYKD